MSRKVNDAASTVCAGILPRSPSAFYQIAVIFAPFLVPVLWAVIIARMSNGTYSKLVHLLRGRDTLAAALLTFATMFLVVFPILSLTFLLVQETSPTEVSWNGSRSVG